MTLSISPDKYHQFKAYLKEGGYLFEDRPYQEFLARKSGIVINLYSNGKIVIGGTDQTERAKIDEYLGLLGASKTGKPLNNATKDLPKIEIEGTRIGTDEVGKGDYFGPLVVAGVLANETQAKLLQEIGVVDSKTLSDVEINKIAKGIREILKPNEHTTVVIGPLAYNKLYAKLQNLNRLLGWGHARAIENVLSTNTSAKTAISDQFGDESYIINTLMEKGRTVSLIQTPKGEREISVAAASILARSEFIYRMRQMSEKYRMEFPKGSTNVIAAAEMFITTWGGRALVNVAKIHFSITKKIGNLPVKDLQWLLSAAPNESQ